MASSTNAAGNKTSMPTIDMLLRLVPDSPDTVLSNLAEHPTMASTADTTGYSLLHAAASYNQLELMRALVKEYNVDVNVQDEEGETPLFAAETLTSAQCLVEELGADTGARNVEGHTAEENALENMEDGGDWHLVADYLERIRTDSAQPSDAAQPPPAAISGDIGNAGIVAPDVEASDAMNGPSGEIRAPPPLPPGVRINMGTMKEEPLDGEGAPDPEFRRRIEELAARDDFHSEEGQRELRSLVSEAIGGLTSSQSGERDVKRRTE